MNFPEWLAQLRAKGWIQPIEFGWKRDAIRALFGEPDDWSHGFKKAEAPMILKYGPVEFHFGPAASDGLHLIYADSAEGIVQLCLHQGSPPDSPG